MKTKEKSTSENKAAGNKNMALAKPVSRVAPKARKTAAPPPSPTPKKSLKKKWDPAAQYF
ncbi:hypothetical protein SAMN04488109_0993 [Chryseolinea serpens]|uniref:Uncharacterized protein n=1 Tax=Chryseolinea serpens TaxID=947013 RepID=A0A1M5L3K5_9BACT|nr:hypothetical protein [Chryseolinea serpens]SHG59520.1 hypothetical protein SAMN04488109_0993 [Chryseolinea serpens]